MSTLTRLRRYSATLARVQVYASLAGLVAGGLASASTLAGPSLSAQSSAAIAQTAIASTSSLAAPGLAAQSASSIAQTAIASASALHSPALSDASIPSIPVGPLASASTLAAPALAPQSAASIAAGPFASTATLAGPGLSAQSSASIAQTALASTSTLVAPTLSEPAADTIAITAIATTSTLAAPGLSPQSAASIAAGPIASTSTLAAPALVDQGPEAIAAGPIASTATLAAPGLSAQSAASIAAGALSSTSTLAAPTLEALTLDLWDNTVYIVAQGQSNMLGRNTGSYGSSATVKVWNRTAGALQTWIPSGSPQHNFPDPGVGSGGANTGRYPLAWHAAKAIADAYSVKTCVICVAWGDTEIENFASGTNIHNELLSQLAAAAPWIPRVDLFLWHQGESDGGDADYFSSDLPALQSLIRALPQANANLPWIAGELEPGRTTFNAALASYAAGATNTAVASSASLTTSDGTHFTAESGQTLGQRMAAFFGDYLAVYNAGATGSAPSSGISDLTATTIDNAQIDLAWTDVADSSVNGYIIEMDSGSGYVEIGRVIAGVETFSATSLTADTAYTFRVYAQNRYGRAVSNTDSATTDASDPVDLPTTNLVARWTADAGVFSDTGVTPAVDTDLVRQWNDQVGTAHLVQATSGERPTYDADALGGNPGLLFSGAQFLEIANTIVSDEPFTFYVVASLDASNVTQCLAAWVHSGGNQDYIALAAGGSNESGIIIARELSTQFTTSTSTPPNVAIDTPFDATLVATANNNRKGYLNGSGEVTDSNSVNAIVNSFSVGALNRSSITYYAQGHIFEVLVYDVAHDTTQIAAVRDYLKYHWGY